MNSSVRTKGRKGGRRSSVSGSGSRAIVMYNNGICNDLGQSVSKSNRGPPFRLHSHYLATYVPVGGGRGRTTMFLKTKANKKIVGRTTKSLQSTIFSPKILSSIDLETCWTFQLHFSSMECLDLTKAADAECAMTAVIRCSDSHG